MNKKERVVAAGVKSIIMKAKKRTATIEGLRTALEKNDIKKIKKFALDLCKPEQAEE